MSTVESQRLLSEDIHLLGDILGRVIRHQSGIEIFELEERIRALTKARRSDPEVNIDGRLNTSISGLNLELAELVSRAFAT